MIQLRRVLVALISVMVGILVQPAFAGVHPVPLEPNTDPAKCLECHEDKIKGPSIEPTIATPDGPAIPAAATSMKVVVHSAMQMGCTACHEIRVTKRGKSKDEEVTRVKLIKATAVGQCLMCHEGKTSSAGNSPIHTPVTRNCLTCHDPHNSPNQFQLKRAPSGGEKENLCLSCHDKGVKVSEKGSRHPALDMGCDVCHVTHKTGSADQRENRFHLVKDAPALCLDCHNATDQDLAKAHRGQPFATADCLGCHDPHQSDKPKLLQKYLHPPFADAACEICHQDAKDGKVILTQATPKELCVTCHSEKAEQIEKAKVQHPGAMGDCTDCHSPHGGDSPRFPKPDGVSICLRCHTDQAELGKKKALHEPAFKRGCGTCHDPHGNDTERLLRAKVPNNLCLECHGPDSKPTKVEAEHALTIFDGKVKLPEDYFARVVRLPLKYGLGHPVDGHPVANVMDPANLNKVLKEMNCLSCHQPHSSAQAGLLAKDQGNNRAFCDTCHTSVAR